MIDKIVVLDFGDCTTPEQVSRRLSEIFGEDEDAGGPIATAPKDGRWLWLKREGSPERFPAYWDGNFFIVKNGHPSQYGRYTHWEPASDAERESLHAVYGKPDHAARAIAAGKEEAAARAAYMPRVCGPIDTAPRDPPQWIWLRAGDGRTTAGYWNGLMFVTPGCASRDTIVGWESMSPDQIARLELAHGKACLAVAEKSPDDWEPTSRLRMRKTNPGFGRIEQLWISPSGAGPEQWRALQTEETDSTTAGTADRDSERAKQSADSADAPSVVSGNAESPAADSGMDWEGKARGILALAGVAKFNVPLVEQIRWALRTAFYQGISAGRRAAYVEQTVTASNAQRAERARCLGWLRYLTGHRSGFSGAHLAEAIREGFPVPADGEAVPQKIGELRPLFGVWPDTEADRILNSMAGPAASSDDGPMWQVPANRLKRAIANSLRVAGTMGHIAGAIAESIRPPARNDEKTRERVAETVDHGSANLTQRASTWTLKYCVAPDWAASAVAEVLGHSAALLPAPQVLALERALRAERARCETLAMMGEESCYDRGAASLFRELGRDIRRGARAEKGGV